MLFAIIYHYTPMIKEYMTSEKEMNDTINFNSILVFDTINQRILS